MSHFVGICCTQYNTSEYFVPTICIEIGSLNVAKPQGTEAAGCWVRLKGLLEKYSSLSSCFSIDNSREHRSDSNFGEC